MTIQQFRANLLCEEQSSRRMRQHFQDVRDTFYGAGDIHITGRPIFIAPDGRQYKSMEAIEEAIGISLIPSFVEILPKTAELRMFCLREKDIHAPCRLDDAEHRILGLDEAVTIEHLVDDANDDFAWDHAIEITLTGSFTAVASNADHVGTDCELCQRRTIKGREVLTVTEVGGGFKTRRLVYRKGDDTVSATYYEAQCA